MKENSNPISSQIIIGLIIIAVGSLLLLDQFGVMSFGNVFQFIPTLFILLGIWQIFSNGFRYWVGPAIMIGISSVVQLSILGVLEDGAVWRLWPLVLIAIGGSILLRQRNGGEDIMLTNSERKHHSSRFNIFAMFGGAERQITAQDFEGGDVTVIFGGAEINLSSAQVTNRPAVINVFTMFGGTGFKASSDQLISLEATAIFGASSDSRKQRKQLPGEQADYIIRGFVMFGGLEIEEAG
ncbi:MAG: LiaF transmembrane domain-containing protein [Candidatus Promineifilaceae bacterium]